MYRATFFAFFRNAFVYFEHLISFHAVALACSVSIWRTNDFYFYSACRIKPAQTHFFPRHSRLLCMLLTKKARFFTLSICRILLQLWNNFGRFPFERNDKHSNGSCDSWKNRRKRLHLILMKYLFIGHFFMAEQTIFCNTLSIAIT